MLLSNYLGPSLPGSIKKNLYIGQVLPSSYSLLLAGLSQKYAGLLVVLVENFNIAYQLEAELINGRLLNQATINILHFPDWETLPYDHFSPHPEIVSERLATLYNLASIQQGILIVPIVTVMHKICPTEYIQQNVFIINHNTELFLDDFKLTLQQVGYNNVPQVMEFGEFAVRGSIIDLFPIGSKLPYRIELVNNQVCSIRTFDVDSQRTIEKVSEIKILPSKEYPFNKESIEKFRTNWREQFSNNGQIYQDVSKGFKSLGLEYYLPLFFERTASLFEYLPKNCLVVRTKGCVLAAENFFLQVESRFEQFRHDVNRSILPIAKLFFNPTEIFSLINNFTQIVCGVDPIKNPSEYNCNLAIRALPDPVSYLFNDSVNKPLRILFCVESKGRKEVLRQSLVKVFKLSIVQDLVDIDSFEEFVNNNIAYGILVAQLQKGFVLEVISTAIVCEEDLFPNKIKQITKRRDKQAVSEFSIKNLVEISIGDPIVHVEHGVGRYLGLTQLDYGAILSEFMVIEYADQNKLFVPITNLNLVHRYSGVDLENAPLHKLGTDRWQKEKNKASKQIKDVAAQLLEIYAVRSSKERNGYAINEENYQKFISNFPFTETFDQNKAILEVIENLKTLKPMDRVICGDVGFGKTEIAMRAAFIVADSGKQVAILAPTTLLAGQHYQNFLDRFADFPIRIELLSRFVTKAKQQEVINKIHTGNCDIVIGTHRLLQKDLKFKALGLLIVDEEHKFGVEQKENFKKMRSEVDLLSLTATPIPRTLNMAMSGIRDISIIATAPNHRLSVKTFVREYNVEIIKEAIQRELQRGGQIYYLHNKVATINKVADQIQLLVPQARVKIAHGQMPERELEHIMVEFYHKKFDVLVCTTIIENGIDIATANTIIIDRADCFGLSQLHQLRGRVGRSHHQAYAFCFTPPLSSLNQDAIKRLEAIENLDTLGAGFTLATHDLEIRGSGELLGSEQSGNIQTIGFSLYMELLEHAVETLKQHGQLDDLLELDFLKNTEIDLQIPAFIPTTYIPDVHTRLILYKDLSKAKTDQQLQELTIEFIDRFGLLPVELQNLFEISKLKLLCEKIGVSVIKNTANGFNIEFNKDNKVNVDKIINLLQSNPNQYKLIGNSKLCCMVKVEAAKRVDFVSKILEDLLGL
jgi:transcription-repair coupling factor (superfamily II helicase)